MLRIDAIDWNLYGPQRNEVPFDVFERNPSLTLVIEAPMLWWFEIKEDVKCTIYDFDEFNRDELLSKKLGDIFRGALTVDYGELVGYAEDYVLGTICSVANREWSDFCETILDIYGIRTLLEERGEL